MAAAKLPIVEKEVLTLPSVGINPQFITSTHVTMESDKYICVRETSPESSVVIIDINTNTDTDTEPLRLPIAADSALMNPNSRILAFKAQLAGTTQDHLQIFSIEAKANIKSNSMPELVLFWKWITPKMLGLVTQTAVYHWSIEGDSEPVEMFKRTANLAKNQIINYLCDPSQKWLVLIGIHPGFLKRIELLKGNMQLFSVDHQQSMALRGFAASFAQFKAPGKEYFSTVLCFATKRVDDRGDIISKLHFTELCSQPDKFARLSKRVKIDIPPYMAEDYPVSVEISEKYGLVFVITKIGHCSVYHLETGTEVYQTRFSTHPIYFTAEASSGGGFYAVNRQGQVLLVTVNEATIAAYVSQQLSDDLF